MRDAHERASSEIAGLSRSDADERRRAALEQELARTAAHIAVYGKR